MEEFCAVLSHYSLIGEVARAKSLLGSPAANTISPEAKEILNCCFGLALGQIADSLSKLKQITAQIYQPIIDFTELLYLNSCAIKESDKIDVLKQNIELESQQFSPQILLIGFVCACVFDPKQFISIFENHAHQDESVNSMLFICELTTNQAPNKLDKYSAHFSDNGTSQIATYAIVLKKIVQNQSNIKQAFFGLKVKSQMLASAFHDQLAIADTPFSEKFQFLSHILQQKTNMSLTDYFKQNYQNQFHQLILNLCASNYQTEPEAVIAIQQYLSQIMTKIVGKPYLIQQKERITSILLQIARAFPTTTCLNILVEFLETHCEVNKYKQLHLLQAYFLGINALLTNNTALALKSVDIFNEVFNNTDINNITGIENFCFKSDDMFIIIQALLGKFDQVKQQLQDHVHDDEMDEEGKQTDFTLLQAIVDQIQFNKFKAGQNQIEKLIQGLQEFEKRIQRQKITGTASQMIDISYGYVLHDTLTYACISQLISEFYNNQDEKLILNNELLTNARAFYDNLYAVSISCKQIRFTRMQIYTNLQSFDYMLKEVSDLSSYASSENNCSISTQELILAASAAASLYKHDEASTYTSQALIMDPSIEKTAEYAKVVAKICSAKGQYVDACKKLQTVLDDMCKKQGDSFKITQLVPIRIHIALLKIKAGELAEGFEIFKQLQIFFPPLMQVINMEMDATSPEFLGMHTAIEKSKAVLYVLRQAGIFNKIAKQKPPQSSFDLLLNEHNILFFDSQILVEKLNEQLNSTFQQGSQQVGAKYIGAAFGPCPINTSVDIFFPPKEIQATEKFQKFAQQQKLNIENIVTLAKPYLQYSLDATELLSQIHLILLNDKVGYVQCYNQLIKAVPSTTRLAALASAHLSVGNAKHAQEFYGKAIEAAKSVIRTTKLPEYIETLVIAFLNVLRSRSLNRCHRYQECEMTIRQLLQNSQFEPISVQTDSEQKMNDEAHLITYAIVSIEYMKLLIKLRQYANLNSIIDQILKICHSKFNLPLDESNSIVSAIPLPVIYLAVYATRAKAELIHQNHVPLPLAERQALLQKCCFWVESNILLKTQRVLPANISLQMRMAQNVFSTQLSQVNDESFSAREQVGLRGIVLVAELRVELAELFLDLARIDPKQLQQNSASMQINFEKKSFLQAAYEHAKFSLRVESARGLIICALHQLLNDNNLEGARTYAVKARQVEPFNGVVQQLMSVISHKMNFDNQDEDQESEKANTPFEDATRILKTGLNVDRVGALDSFLLNSCLVHDMTVVTDCLFGTQEDDDVATATADNIFSTDFQNLNDLNERSDKIVNTNFDGYYFLGRGFLSLKMGRIQDGFKSIMTAVNSQTLNDRYRVRALYLLGQIYINPTRSPLYGFTSCLTGKQQSAVALQKNALNQNAAQNGNNVNFIEDQVQQVDNQDIIVPDVEVLNQRDEDLQEAIQILGSLEQMSLKNVAEADELACVLKGFIRVGQYNQSKDKIARVLQDEGRSAGRTKLSQLELIKEESKAQISEQCEILHDMLNRIDKNEPNYVVIMYALGVLYVQLKNEAKARSSFTTGAKQITSIRELGAQAQQSQASLWLDVDASVQCNLALSDQYVCIGKITNALRSLDAVAALDKIQTISYEMYGLCMEKESAFDDAVKYYESAWLLSKGSPSVAYRLAYNYMKANKYTDAILMCQSALNEWPQFQKLRKEVLYKAEEMIKTLRGQK